LLFPLKLKTQQLEDLGMVRVDMVFSQLRSKVGNFQFSSLPAQGSILEEYPGSRTFYWWGELVSGFDLRIPRVADDKLSWWGGDVWSHNVAIAGKVLLYTLSV